MEVTAKGTAIFRYKHRIITVALVAAGLLIIGFGSMAVRAAVPTISGAVRACYQTSGAFANGQTRIIDTATQSCSVDETAVDLSKATPGDFVTNLAGGDFTGVNFAYRNFADANMSGSLFYQTSMRGGDFRLANLSGSTFSSIIDMTGTNLTGTNLANTQWTNGGAINGDFRQATLTGMQFNGSSFENSNFQGVDFSTTNLFGGGFSNGTNLSSADFTGAYDTGNNLSIAVYSANLASADFSGSGHVLLNSTFHQANVAGADFTNVLFQDSNLGQTDFTGATLSGATWSNTICPDGTNSNDNGNTCSGHLSP